MIVFCDIDNTICHTQGNDYENATPIPENIEKINKLFIDGNTIIYWTARGGTSGKDWSELTHKQLKEWGCYSSEVRMGKPNFDLFIDDKSIRIKEL